MTTIVIGAGHNGLAAALTLARAGRTVVVLEARSTVGGIAAGAEFAPGYRHRGLLHDTDCVRPEWIKALKLPTEPAPEVYTPAGTGFRGVSGDGGHPAYQAFLDTVRPFARSVLDAAPPALGQDMRLWDLAKPALGLRRLGQKDMLRLLRIGPMPVDDWLQTLFGDAAVRAAVCLPALVGGWVGPRSPLTTANLLLREALSGPEVVGGSAALVDALEKACIAARVDIRTGHRVARIEPQGDTLRVVTTDGASFGAVQVLSAIGPRATLRTLLDPMEVPGAAATEIEKVRVRGTWAKVHLGLSEAPTFGGQSLSRVRTAAHPLDLERAFDDVKYGRLPSNTPPLDVRVYGSEAGPVASILVRAPYHLKGGWTDEARASLLESVLAALEAHDAGIRGKVVAQQLLTPADLESEYGLEGGHLFHGEVALDQLWAQRPTPSLGRYRTPIRGLFLGSTGTHPGGPVTCGPGTLAARAMLG